jgi:prepilin-type N-terminal cleavage/methylation domain-containing protein
MRKAGFSLIESLMAISLMALVLFLVAQGYARLAQLNTFSESSSRQVELMAVVQTITDEVSCSFAVRSPNPRELHLTRVDPSLNLQYNESRQRLPWPLVSPASLTPLSGQRDPYNVEVRFRFVANANGNQLVREQVPLRGNTSASQSAAVVEGLEDFRVLQVAPLVELELLVASNQSPYRVSVFRPVGVAP